MGSIFIIKPYYSVLIYLSTYIIYYFSIGLSQKESVLLLSNRINGSTGIFLGLFLSLLIWRSHVINLQQKERIERQQYELEEKNRQLQLLATTDSLTGLINRMTFEERITNELARIKRYGDKSCLLILDIDDFKCVNDLYGHPVGDWVLVKLADFLRKQLRQTDVISRIGGEEFAIILTNTVEEEGQIVARKILKNLEKEFLTIDGKKLHITLSIGLVALTSRNSFEESYRMADKALYKAKSNGKNRVEME